MRRSPRPVSGAGGFEINAQRGALLDGGGGRHTFSGFRYGWLYGGGSCNIDIALQTRM